MPIRAVRLDELPVLQDIERAAGQCFRDIGMPEIAEDEPLPLGELARYHHAGMAWVVAIDSDAPFAYMIADRFDGNLHVEQVSVHPDSARRGVGRLLLEHLASHARSEGAPALTLATFTQVPWNAPYYSRCGFHGCRCGGSGDVRRRRLRGRL
ncbi:GNAT family N-acetyltransferase [Streptomyces sp. CB01635]|nr:GNAT family N-acetyltransferase [Streptomyces sp. CB01635]